MADMELDIVAVEEVDEVANISDPKLTRLACLLSFVSLFGAKENFALNIKLQGF